MTCTIDERAVRKLALAFGLIAVIVIGTVAAVAVTDSDGTITEKETAYATIIGDSTASNSCISATLSFYVDSDGGCHERISVTLTSAGKSYEKVGIYNVAADGSRCNATTTYTKYFTADESRTNPFWSDSSFGPKQVRGYESSYGGPTMTMYFWVGPDYDNPAYQVSIKYTMGVKTVYEYTTSITYDANGGTNAPSKTSTSGKSEGSAPTGTDSLTVSSDVPTYEGHTFLGWSASKSGNPTIKAGSVQSIDKGSDITVYAQWEIVSSKLLLMSEGKTFHTEVKDWGTTVQIPTDIPTRQGYSFIGWSATDGSSTAEIYAGDSVTLKGDKTLYAVWDLNPIEFTLTFDANEGTGAPEKLTRTAKTETTDFTIPSTLPTLDGYGCVGWSTSRNGELAYKVGDTISVPYAEPNEVLYAVWKPLVTFTLSFDADDGQNAPSPVSGRTIESSISLRIPSTEPTRTGYKFLGWSETASADTVQWYAGQSIEVSKTSTTLYAVWEKQPVLFSLKFDANGGEGVPTADAVRTADTSVRIAVPAGTPEWEGHVFLGWATSATATSAAYRPGDSVTLKDSEPVVTLYAVWKTLTLYTLAFDANTGSDAPASVTGWGDGSCVLTVPAGVPTKDDNRFVGWATSATATSAAYQRGDSVTVASATVTLYAVWEWTTEITFTLTFDANNGQNAPQSKSGTAKAPSLTLDVPKDVPTRDGFEFRGWALNADATAADYVGGDRIVLTAESTTLFAVWKEIVTYTLDFDANNGQNAPEPVSGTSTEGSCELTVPEDVPTRTGYKFLGWSASKETLSPEIQPGQILTVTESKTLYAIWNEVVTFTIRFDANNGTNAPSPVSGTSDTGSCSLTVPSQAPTREGFSFAGWSRASSATSAEIQPGASVETSVRSLTLYAVWTEHPHISFAGESELTVLVGGTASSTVQWTPADAEVVADGPSWMAFSEGTIDITAPASADVGVLTLTATADGYTQTTWTLTVRVIPPEDAEIVELHGNGAEDRYVFVVSGGKLTVPTEPTREGFSFTGWYTQDGERYDFDTPVTGTLVLVAHWDDGEDGGSFSIAWILVGALAVIAAFVVARRFI